MDLTTVYAGLTLKSPIIISSSGITSNISNLVKCEEYGVGAVVLKSLYEEEIVSNDKRFEDQDSMYFWYPEAIKHVKGIAGKQGLQEYIRFVEKAKKSVNVPVIASINCVSDELWPAFASQIEKAGADALELNIAIPPTSYTHSSEAIEEFYIDIIKSVKEYTSIPVCIKTGFYFTNLLQMAIKIENAGAEGIVLFNRYYRPDIDINKIQVVQNNVFSHPEEITLSLRWISLLEREVEIDLCASTGIHDHTGVIKQILCGAKAVQIATTLYKNNLSYITEIHENIEKWMDKHHYAKLDDFRGIISRSDEYSEGFERIHFMQKTSGTLKINT